MSKISIDKKTGKVSNRLTKPEMVNDRVMQMLYSGVMSDFLPLNAVPHGKDLTLECQPQGLVSAVQFFSAPVDKMTFFTFVEKVLNVIQNCVNQNISADNIDLQNDLVFVDQRSGAVKCILWPVANNMRCQSPAVFFKQLPFIVRFFPGEDVSFFQKYGEYFDGLTPFSVDSFGKLIEELIKSSPARNFNAMQQGGMADQFQNRPPLTGVPDQLPNQPQQSGMPGQFPNQPQQGGMPGQFPNQPQQNGMPGQFQNQPQQNGMPGQFPNQPQFPQQEQQQNKKAKKEKKNKAVSNQPSFPQQGGMPGQFPNQPQQGGMPGQFPNQPQQNGMPGQFPNQPQQGGIPGQFPNQPQQGGMPGQFPNQPQFPQQEQQQKKKAKKEKKNKAVPNQPSFPQQGGMPGQFPNQPQQGGMPGQFPNQPTFPQPDNNIQMPAQPTFPQPDTRNAVKPNGEKTLKCTTCGAPNVAAAKFCAVCGAKMEPVNMPAMPTMPAAPVMPNMPVSADLPNNAAAPVSAPQEEMGTTVLGNDSATVVWNEIVQPTKHGVLIREKTKERIVADKPEFVIGKKEGCDYVIKGDSFVSRRHAKIVTKDGHFFIVDNRSTNKTFVNGKVIPSDVEIEIFEGAQIRMADEDFVFTVE